MPIEKIVHRILSADRGRHCLVLKNYNLAYARIPKAANSSIKHALHEMLFGPEPNHIANVNRDKFWHKHPSGQAEMMTPAQARKTYPSLYIFSFVRNPYARMVSCYYNKIVYRDKLSHFFKRNGFSKEMSFAEFVEKAVLFDDRVTDIHLCSQSHILSDKGELYPDFIGRIEEMDTDWARLREILLSRSAIKLPVLRRINTGKYPTQSAATLFSDASLRKLVQQRYAADFENFYTDFDLLAN